MNAQRADVTGVPHAVVVGIAYPNTDLYDRARRTFDFTFGPAVSEPDDSSLAVGGGAAFVDFLEMAIKPLVEHEAPICQINQTLIGHSLGGLFALSVLIRRPGSFRNYIASSPSIWWDPRGFQVADPPPANTSVFLCAGEYEQALPPWMNRDAVAERILLRREERGMVRNARELATLLAASGLRAEFQEFPGEDHASAALMAINRGLRFALRK
jgi:predicted alpha/beta superfamily hydrolase